MQVSIGYVTEPITQKVRLDRRKTGRLLANVTAWNVGWINAYPFSNISALCWAARRAGRKALFPRRKFANVFVSCRPKFFVYSDAPRFVHCRVCFVFFYISAVA